MSLCRLLLRRSLHRTTTTIASTQTEISHPQSSHSLLALRSFAFSSAEDAAAERRRRKRRLRIEPPIHSLRRDTPSPRPPPDPNAPRLPDTTSSLVGPRLNLHNRVQSLIRAGDLDGASTVARHSSRPRPTVFTCNAATAAMYRSKRYDDAVALFQFFFNQSNIVPNVVSYNVLINTHCDSGRVDKALEVYRHILENAPFTPSAVTYRHLTKGLIDSGRIGEAVDLLREMLIKGHGADSLVYNNLIKGFLDLGSLERANELFDELKERCLVYDGVVNATFMDWYFNLGKEKEAMESYRSLLDRKFRMIPATCNVLLECLLRNGRKKDAWELFDTMLDNHTPPNFQAVNSDTFSIMVNECFKLGKFSEAVETFRKVGIKEKSKPFSMDVAGYNNIIVRFVKHGMIEEAEKFFEELRSKSLSPNVTGYRTLIDSYLKEKRINDALQMFRQMVDANLRVIPEYANRWFSELIDNDKAFESSQILTKMGEKEPKPNVLTYEIVIKGLCQAGAFDQCKEIINQMMGYSVGLTPTLREFLVDTFEKEGKKDEIEKLIIPRRQVIGAHSQPSIAQNQRLPQSTVPIAASQNQMPAKRFGQWGNGGFAGPTEYTEYTRPAYQLGSQAGSVSASPGVTGFVSTVGHAGSTGSYTGTNEPPGYSAQVGSTRFSGSVEQMGHAGIGYPNQYAPQSGLMGSQGNVNYATNATNQKAYEPSGFSAQEGSMRYSGPVGNGGQPRYTEYAGPSSSQGHAENAGYQGDYGDAESYAQVGSGYF